MKIIKLQAENVKRLKVVEITPEGDLVQITGKNAQGKTSVLDSIWWAMGGAENIQEQPIRRGQEQASVKLNLGDIIVVRKWGKGAGLAVYENSRGESSPDLKTLPKYGSPQELLDGLIGGLSFDPLAFSRKKPREQYDELRTIVKVDFDLEAMEAANAQDYEERKRANADHKRLQAEANGITFKFEDSGGLIDTSDIAAKITAAAEAKKEHALKLQRRGAIAGRLKSLFVEIDSIQVRKDKIEKTYTNRLAEIDEMKARALKVRETDLSAVDALQEELGYERVGLEEEDSALGSLPTELDDETSLLISRMDEAARKNGEWNERQRQAKLLDAAAAAKTRSEELSNKIDQRAKEHQAAMEAVQMPVPGLVLAAGSVYYDGLPLDQASDAEQLRISCAIAMAGNPKLRVIRVRDGSLLDEGGIRMLGELAREKDFQIWLERVDSSGKIGIVIEDGEVAAAKPE